VKASTLDDTIATLPPADRARQPVGAAEAASSLPRCVHCGEPAPQGSRFCCPGCAVAFETVRGLGLGAYYERRVLDPAQRAPRPERAEARDLSRFIAERPDGAHEITLAVDGLQCGACVWLIETVLGRDPAVTTGRVNMTSRRLRLAWTGAREDAGRLVAAIESLGYRLVPFDAEALAATRDETGRSLMRALAVAGFAAANVMFMSIGVWAGEAAGWLDSMGPATRDLLHWVSALIAMPAVAYAGLPFFRSAAAALRQGRTNMDVPISVGVTLVTAMSLSETLASGPHAYFDSAITLLFFLLVGRVLDHRARGQAREIAEQLLTLRNVDAAVMMADGSIVRRSQHAIHPGDRILVGTGERVAADGMVEHGASSVDTALVTGESLPVAVAPGATVFAGTLNLGEPLLVRATATGGSTLLAECVRLIEAAEARRSRFVVLADRVARTYAPAVHLAAVLTFLGWYVGMGASLNDSLLIAAAVLIITCPCALALAVPAVQVIATSRLFRAGMLLKSPTALERLAEVDMVVFDKTGTLTEPSLALVRAGVDAEALRVAASLAAASRHPLARALAAAAGPVTLRDGITEHAGQGLEAGDIRLGSRTFCRIDAADLDAAAGNGTPEIWLTRPGQPPSRFTFDEHPRPDADTVVRRLLDWGFRVHLLSGDTAPAVARIAALLGIQSWQAAQSPVEKVAAIEAFGSAGHHVLMVGDGLNDSPSLAAAHVSASPATAADISQTLADAVFQGHGLSPVIALIATARRARGVMRENLALAIGYNVLMVPLAVAGYVTPWVAAAAMSTSSILVIANSFRAGRSA
jgi:Cu2+-exporting ATPase